MQETIKNFYNESIQIQVASADTLSEPLERASEMLVARLLQGNRVFSCGDSRSNLVAEHFANLLLHGCSIERPPFPAVGLTEYTGISDQSESISRQVSALGSAGDLLIAFTSQQSSDRVHKAMEAALSREMTIITITGDDASEVTGLLGPDDLEIRIPSVSPARVAEQQLLISHLLCELIEEQIFQGGF